MKKIRKIVSVILMLVLLFTLTVPALAIKASSSRDYNVYMCIGDSIAAGTCLRRDGTECLFPQDVSKDAAWGAADDAEIFRGFNYEVAPNAYHSLIRDGLSSALGHDVKLIQAARSGLRASELRYLLDGTFNDFDETHIWGNTFFNAENLIMQMERGMSVSQVASDPLPDLFTLEDISVLDTHLGVGQKGRCDNYLEGFDHFFEGSPSRVDDPDYIAVSSYRDAIEKADVISLNLGSNDVFSFSLLYVLCKMQELSIPGISAVTDLLRETGDLGAAFAELVDTCETVGMLPALVNLLLNTLRKALDQFKENYTAAVEEIYLINPDVDIVAISCYNPLSHVRISSGSSFNLDAIAAPFLLELNGVIESFSTGKHAGHYFYCDVSGTETFDMNADDNLFMEYFIFKVHPTLAGHRFMADQVLKTLCDNGHSVLFAGNVHYIRLFEQLLKNITNNIIALFARVLGSGFTFGPVSFGK